MDLWEKYKNESDQTICIIGILILSAKICIADGHFSEFEKDEILKILPHEPRQRKILINILDEAIADKNDVEYHAIRIKKIISDNKDFLEFIIAVLYRLGHSDHVYSKEEDIEIKKVAEVFGIKKNFIQNLKENIRSFFSKGDLKVNA